MNLMNETKARNIANRELARMPNYHRFIPTEDIDSALRLAGLRELEPAIYCGREGSCISQVGEKSYLNLTWYKMESGNYEIVAYVS